MTNVDLDPQTNSRRVVVLGASNVTLGLPTIVHHVRSGFTGPLQMDIADGHGRSYGDWTSVLFRRVPGHHEGAVPDFESHHQKHALLTDIGNDLVYGTDAGQIAAWVSDVAHRFADVGAELTMTGLPLASVHSLSKNRFRFFRTLFFPSSPLRYDGLISKVEELDARIKEIAIDVGAAKVDPEAEWYGLDPIHIRRSDRSAAWTHVLKSWHSWEPRETRDLSLLTKIRLWRSKPQQRQLLGKLRCHQQVVRLDHETTIRFF
ncbi:MAG: hypothetical protein AB8G99_18475 [Planctomycetaceae bacterium]